MTIKIKNLSILKVKLLMLTAQKHKSDNKKKKFTDSFEFI